MLHIVCCHAQQLHAACNDNSSLCIQIATTMSVANQRPSKRPKKNWQIERKGERKNKRRKAATSGVKVGHKFVIGATSSDNYEHPFNKVASESDREIGKWRERGRRLCHL